MKLFIASPGYKAYHFAHMHICTLVAQLLPKDTEVYHIILDDCNESKIGRVPQNTDLLISHTRNGPMKSHIEIMEHITRKYNPDNDDVIVHLDLDDWLFSPMSLCIVADEYTHNDIWATYGSYIPTEPPYTQLCKPYTRKFDRVNSFNWFFSHLRTFKYGLWKHIDYSYFKNKNGEYYPMAADVAICSCILELCPVNKVKFIERPLVVYNTYTNLNENKVNQTLQAECVRDIMSKPKLAELTCL